MKRFPLPQIALSAALAFAGASAVAQDAGTGATSSEPKALSQGNYENKTDSTQSTRKDRASGMTSGSGDSGMTSGAYAKKKKRAEQKANRPQTATDTSTDRNRSVNQGTQGVDANPTGSKATPR